MQFVFGQISKKERFLILENAFVNICLKNFIGKVIHIKPYDFFIDP